MTSAKKFTLKRIVIVIITAIFLFSTVSLVATKMVYDRLFARYDVQPSPAEALFSMVQQRQTFYYDSGENTLTGYLYQTRASDRQTGLVILVPGFHAGADDYLWQIRSLLDHGWSVFAFDPTGSGNSEGESLVGFSQVLLDTEATLKYVEKMQRFGYNELALFGHSQGGYAACCALRADYDIAAVVSVSGVNSAMEGVICMAESYVGPLAYGNYGFLWLYQSMLFGSDTVNARAEDIISESGVPVLVVHGSLDDQIPMEQYSIISHKDEIRSEEVEYIICSTPNQNGHTDLLFQADGSANSVLMEQIHAFLIKSIVDR